MASTYGYTTLATVEKLMGIDLSTVDAVAFADGNMEAQITSAEKMINGYLGETVDQTDTDGIETCANYISIQLINATLILLGYQDLTYNVVGITNLSIPEMFSMFLDETTDSLVDSIPMSGASYYKPDISRL